MASRDQRPQRPGMVVGFLGATRTRKTTLMRECIRRTAGKDKRLRFMIWDAGNVSAQFIAGEVRKGKYYPTPGTLPVEQSFIYHDLKTARDRLLDHESGQAHMLAYQFHVFQGEIDFEEFVALCVDVAGCVCVVDEIDMVTSKGNIPDALSRIVNTGRHIDGAFGQRGVSLMFASRRLQKTHNDLLSACLATGVTFLTKMKLARDISKVQEEAGIELPDLANLDPDQSEFIRLDGGDVYDGPQGLALVLEGLTPYYYERVVDVREIETPHQSDQTDQPEPEPETPPGMGGTETEK